MSTQKYAPQVPFAPVMHVAKASTSTHSVQFYTEDAFLLDMLSRFIGTALGAGDPGIVIATPAHRKGLKERLTARGLNLELAARQGRYLEFDAETTLTRFMIDDWPDTSLFFRHMAGVFSHARALVHDAPAAVFGEMVALLWAQGKHDAAIRLEQLWNDFARVHSFSLLCAYPISLFNREADGELLRHVCAEHSRVTPAESYASLESEGERLRTIAFLQQKAEALNTEIAERKRMEQELRESAERLQAVFNQGYCFAAILDREGTLLDVNTAATEATGFSRDELIGRLIWNAGWWSNLPHEQQDLKEAVAHVLQGNSVRSDTRYITAEGKERLADRSLTPVKNDVGEVVLIVASGIDITGRKRSEEALRRSEKLAATGRLAATIAHEINNPMESLTNLLFLLRSNASLDEDARHYVALAERELSRTSHITRQMLTFHRESARSVNIDLSELLDGVLDLFEAKLDSRNISVTKLYTAERQVEGYPSEIRQLFVNLVGNAIEAIGRNGRLRIRVARSRDWRNPERRGIRVAIGDTGSGIAPDCQGKLFEPFFTTKGESGTGLGLWVSRGIVEKHEGTIRFRSSVRRGRCGTVFSVFLPAIETGSAVAAAE